VTPNVVKTWAIENNIKYYTPVKLDMESVETLKSSDCALYVVASYGKIIPDAVLDIPKYKTLNIHPSLLPRYRGASPLQSAMINDEKDTGVSIMRIDSEMDHGPIISRETVTVSEWLPYEKFEEFMAKIGAKLLVKTIPDWVGGIIGENEQNHKLATYTKKINKEDALLDLKGNPYDNFRKIQAYSESPVAYFMHKHGDKEIKVKITSALYKDGNLIIEKVIPEGSKEMSYDDFVRGYKK